MNLKTPVPGSPEAEAERRSRLFRDAVLEAGDSTIAHYAGPKAERWVGPSILWHEGPGENHINVQFTPRWECTRGEGQGWWATLSLSSELSRAAALRWAVGKTDCFTEELGRLNAELYFGKNFPVALTTAAQTVAGFMLFQANAAIERDNALAGLA